MTIEILKPSIESGEPVILASIDGELPEPYTEKGLSESMQSNITSNALSPARDITQFVNYADC